MVSSSCRTKVGVSSDSSSFFCLGCCFVGTQGIRSLFSFNKAVKVVSERFEPGYLKVKYVVISTMNATFTPNVGVIGASKEIKHIGLNGMYEFAAAGLKHLLL